ncbi:ABC transporter ATP-binding protein [Gracilibacillus alcaliphilus]
MEILSTSNVFIRLLRMGKRYVIWYIILCLLTVILSLLSVATAEMFNRLANAAVDKNMSLLINTVFLAVGILIVNLTVAILKKVLSERLMLRSTLYMQSNVLKNTLNTKMTNLDKYHTGDIINRITDSVQEAQAGVNIKSQEVLGNVLQIIFLLSYFSFINIPLTVGALLLAVILPMIINLVSKPMRNLYESRQHAIGEKESFIQDVIQGAEVVRSYSLTERMKRALERKYNQYLKYHFKVQRYEVALFRSHTLIWLLGILYIFGYGGYLVSINQLNVGDVVAFAISFERLAFPLSGLAGIWSQFQHSLSHGRRIFELLDLSKEQKLKEINRTTQIEDIHIEDVYFSYHQNQASLKGISMTLQKGKSTALIGPSGSGKSTLANLLLALYEPSKGNIYYGVDCLQDLDISDWRSRIAYIPQEPVLFTGTIFENIAIGKEGATLEEVISAAKSAQIHNSISNTRKQYDSVIGEDGLQLSGGEQQRITIARAFLSNPDIVILDEPTSSLDNTNERLIVEQLLEIFKGKTILIISHRLATIQHADHSAFMEDGQIIESGSHQELMQKKGKFYKMYYDGQKEGVI